MMSPNDSESPHEERVPSAGRSRLAAAGRLAILGATAGVVLAVLDAVRNWLAFGGLPKDEGATDAVLAIVMMVSFGLTGAVLGGLAGFFIGSRSGSVREHR